MLQFIDLWYQRRSELDVDTQLQSRGFEYDEELVVRQFPRHFHFGLACAHNSFQSRGFEDNDDLFERDTDLETREPGFQIGSVLFI